MIPPDISLGEGTALILLGCALLLGFVRLARGSAAPDHLVAGDALGVIGDRQALPLLTILTKRKVG